MTKHTPEPWKVAEVWYDFMAVSDSGTEIFVQGTQADAERIVACVNAMAGITDPAAFVAAAIKAGVAND